MTIKITVFDADVYPLDRVIEHALFSWGNQSKVVPHLMSFDRALLWTEIEQAGDRPSVCNIITMTERFTYLSPRLVMATNRFTIIKALSDRGESGTLQTIRSFFIMIERE